MGPLCPTDTVGLGDTARLTIPVVNELTLGPPAGLLLASCQPLGRGCESALGRHTIQRGHRSWEPPQTQSCSRKPAQSKRPAGGSPSGPGEAPPGGLEFRALWRNPLSHPQPACPCSRRGLCPHRVSLKHFRDITELISFVLHIIPVELVSFDG